jgi:hypothetical protein
MCKVVGTPQCQCRLTILLLQLFRFIKALRKGMFPLRNTGLKPDLIYFNISLWLSLPGSSIFVCVFKIILMKINKVLLYLTTVLFLFISASVQAQLLKKVLGDKKDSSSSTNILNNVLGKGGTLSTDDIAAGLKEALSVGAEKAGKNLSSIDGYFANAAIKILMPEEAKKAEQKLRAIGLGKQVDEAILSMNRAAEDAAKSATPIFVNAIKQMSIQDAAGILKGGDFAATDYLKDKTTSALTASFRPVIEKSLEKVDATKYWNTVFTAYNKFSANKINPDLPAYVTEKALSGIFYQVAQEEQQIRKNPVARTSEILKKVFDTN